MFKLNDKVKGRASCERIGEIGSIVAKKPIDYPFGNYWLFQVEYEDGFKEWINESYLTKV